jgi:hypothetical protein
MVIGCADCLVLLLEEKQARVTTDLNLTHHQVQPVQVHRASFTTVGT